MITWILVILYRTGGKTDRIQAVSIKSGAGKIPFGRTTGGQGQGPLEAERLDNRPGGSRR